MQRNNNHIELTSPILGVAATCTVIATITTTIITG